MNAPVFNIYIASESEAVSIVNGKLPVLFVIGF